MKRNQWLLTVSLIASLFAITLPSYAEMCGTAHFDRTTALITLPCVKAGKQQLSLTLKNSIPAGETSQNFWELNSYDASSCTVIGGECAEFDENLDLIVPVEGVLETGVKHVGILRYYSNPTVKGFYWQYADTRPIDLNNTVKLSQGTFNPQGSFEQLLTLDANFAADFDKVKDLMTINAGVTVPKSQLTTGQEMILKIYHFNDLHNELRTVSKTRGDTHYFSQMVKIVKAARENAASNEIVLFVGAGDDHIGNPFDELMGYDVNSFKASAAYTTYSAAGVDAVAIGNHELDRGTALLAKAIETNAHFPVLSANLYGSQHLKSNHYYPAVVGVAKGLRIGIIGLTTREETLLTQKDDAEFGAGDLLPTLKNTIDYVEPLSDVIIILSHVGYNGDVEGQMRHELEVGDIQIAETAAKATDKPVVVIGGHMHLKLNTNGLNIVNKSVPILQAGAKGNSLGEATWSLFNSEVGLRGQMTARLIPLKRRDDRVPADDPTYNTYEHDEDIDAEFENTVMAPLYAMLDTQLQEIIGSAGNSQDLTTEKTHADRYLGETVIANFMNDAIVVQSFDFPEKEGKSQAVDVAVFNASGVNGGIIPNSQITFNDWYNVMPFADMIIVTQMTGKQIKEMLMSNAKRVVRPEESTGATPPDLTGYISRGFLNFSRDLRYTIKLNDSAVHAIAQDITLKGRPIDEQLDQVFNVAFGDYVALRGGEGWNGKKVGAGLPDEIIGIDLTTLPKNDTGLVYRNEIIAFIRKNAVVNEGTGAVKDGRVKIIP